MRVVGGKTGSDGRLFAYIVWTVPGGPAEKVGLQQGDKVSATEVWWLSARTLKRIMNICFSVQ
jgi:hypothetical protein